MGTVVWIHLWCGTELAVLCDNKPIRSEVSCILFLPEVDQIVAGFTLMRRRSLPWCVNGTYSTVPSTVAKIV